MGVIHTEEINKREHSESASAKRVIPVVYDGANWVPAGQSKTTVRHDDTSSTTYEYFGFATPGSATSSNVWQIMRITIATGDVIFADGDSNFDNVWDNHLSLTYL